MAKQLANRLLGIVAVLLMMAMPLEANAGPVTVKSGIVNGTVAVDKATANPGETVTITVTPDMGYYAVKENVKAEMTVDGGSAQAPRLNVLSNMPVGRYVEVQGNAPADVSGEASYTFTMPDAPYGVQVSAEFLARIPISIDMLPLIPDQPYTGSEITPDVTIMDGDIELIPDKDYTIEFSDNVGPGQATFTITGKGKYTRQQSRNFTIYRETYEVRWGQGDPWPETNMIPMTEDAATGKWVVADQEMAATSSFKVVKKYNAGAEPVYTWYGAQADGMFWITSEKLGTEITLGTTDDYRNLYFPYDGIYTFTFDPATSKLVVSGDIFYKVTVANGIEYGIVVANPISAKAGDPVTITATPEIGYKLSHLYVNGENVIANEENGVYTYTFNMPATDVTVNATFSLKLYTITKAPTEHGSFDLSMEAGVMGDDIQILPEPEANYVVDQITVTAEDGSPVEVNDLNIFKMPASNVTVAVTFKLADYTITVAPTQNGTVEAPASAHYGEEVELTVTPEPGYELETLTYTVEGGEPVDIENGKFNMPAGNVTINATFKQTEIELEGVSFGAEHQWATYYNGAQNLALPQNVKAYVVNSVIGDAVDITEIDYIPAGVGVLLYSELPADHVAATLFNGTTGTYNSIIVGSDEEQSITDGYVLYNNAFVLTKEGTIAAHRCYLPIASAAGAPRMLRIGVTPIITAIDDIVAQGNVAGIKYVNMSGATSNEPFQGVNIAVITMTDGSTRTVKVVK